MNPDQQIRAAAAQAAATLMAPVQPLPADYVAVAEVVEAFIRDGKQAAFAICFTEQPQELPAAAPEQAAPVAAPEPPPAPAAEPEPENRQPDAEVIPLAARGKTSVKQETASKIVRDTKRKRVDSIVAEASMAKVKAHKERLINDADDAGLSDYAIVIEGKPTTLGAYLESL